MKYITNFIKKYPLPSFITLLALLFVLIVVSNTLNKPVVKEEQVKSIAKEVQTFSVGDKASINAQAKIQKTGTITVYAQVAGIVKKVYIEEGKYVYQGNNGVYLASNYNGAVVSTVSRQIAQKQYENIIANYDTQKEIINKSRDLAFKQENSASELRSINSKTIQDTKNLVSLNEDILKTIDANITTLTDTNIGGSNNSAILSAKQAKAQLQSGLIQLKNTLNLAEYNTNNDNAPAQSTIVVRDSTLKQLDLQEKGLNLSRDISKLQLTLAQIQESLNYPTVPCSGVVERVFVKENDIVNPGQALFTVTAQTNSIKAVVLLPENLVNKVSTALESTLYSTRTPVYARPTHISTAPVEGNLYAITYVLPVSYAQNFSDGSYINVTIPLNDKTNSTIPLDSIYKTEKDAYIQVVDGNHAKTKQITIGNLYGSFAEVTSGLATNEAIILNRNVLNGDEIIIKN